MAVEAGWPAGTKLTLKSKAVDLEFYILFGEVAQLVVGPIDGYDTNHSQRVWSRRGDRAQPDNPTFRTLQSADSKNSHRSSLRHGWKGITTRLRSTLHKFCHQIPPHRGSAPGAATAPHTKRRNSTMMLPQFPFLSSLATVGCQKKRKCPAPRPDATCTPLIEMATTGAAVVRKSKKKQI